MQQRTNPEAMALAERMARLEAMVEARLVEILRRLDAINGSVARTSQRMDEHERAHWNRDERLAHWQGEMRERLSEHDRSGEAARWRATLIATMLLGVANLLVQILVRLR